MRFMISVEVSRVMVVPQVLPQWRSKILGQAVGRRADGVENESQGDSLFDHLEPVNQGFSEPCGQRRFTTPSGRKNFLSRRVVLRTTASVGSLTDLLYVGAL
jgi:hypothetical protein